MGDFYCLMLWDQLDLATKKELVHWLRLAIDDMRDNFQSQIIRLAFKADSENTRKLFSVYPKELAVVSAWKAERIRPDFTLAETEA